MNTTKQENPGAVAGQVDRGVRPAAIVCDQHASGGAVVRWAGSGMPCPPETPLYTRAALDAAVAAERERWAAAFTEARDAVLQDRGPLEAAGMDADKTNAVLAVLDDAFAGLC
jgi:hypothetical protein